MCYNTIIMTSAAKRFSAALRLRLPGAARKENHLEERSSEKKRNIGRSILMVLLSILLVGMTTAAICGVVFAMYIKNISATMWRSIWTATG